MRRCLIRKMTCPEACGAGGIRRMTALRQKRPSIGFVSAKCQKQACHTSKYCSATRKSPRQGATIALGRLPGGQGELKYRTARFIRFCPQPAPMGVDDRPTNRQPHPCSAGLCGVEGIENAIEMFRIDARPGIVDCHKDTCVVLLGADQ